MLGMTLFRHYRNNYRLWRQYQSLPRGCRLPSGYFPSEIYFKYPPSYDFGGRKVLNFGCGRTVYAAPNVTNTDIAPGPGAVVRDPARPLSQFGTDFDLVIANHVLEHVPDWFGCFKEMTEIVRPGGRIEIYVPPISSDSAFSYRDHINRIGFRSFNGLGPNANAGSNLAVGEEFARDKDLRKVAVVAYTVRPCIKWWTLLAWPSLLRWMTEHLRNIASEEGFIFEKLP